MACIFIEGVISDCPSRAIMCKGVSVEGLRLQICIIEFAVEFTVGIQINFVLRIVQWETNLNDDAPWTEC
jgi:hypothetical protein